MICFGILATIESLASYLTGDPRSWPKELDAKKHAIINSNELKTTDMFTGLVSTLVLTLL